MLQQEKRANLLKETPQYKQALFNLQLAKKEALRTETIRQMLSNLPVEQIPEFLLRQGQIDLYKQERESSDLRGRIELRGDKQEELARAKHRYKLAEIEAKKKADITTRKFPVRYVKPLSTKEKVFGELYKEYQESNKTLDEFVNELPDSKKKIWDSMFRSLTTAELLRPFINDKPIVDLD